jgi:hypothetical protein
LHRIETSSDEVVAEKIRTAVRAMLAAPLRRAEPHQWPTGRGFDSASSTPPEGLTPKLGAPSSLLSDDAIEQQAFK